MHTADPTRAFGARRVLVVGVSGVGKSTLAAELADRLALPYTELDAMFHGPGWVPRPEFEAEVAELAGRESWVTEWQYTGAREVLAARAELLVWLDLPFWTVTLPRVVRRTLRRRLGRQRLWNGNVEPPLHTIFTDPEHIVRWAWSTRKVYGDRVAALQRRRPELPVVRLRSVAAAQRWLGSVRP